MHFCRTVHNLVLLTGRCPFLVDSSSLSVLQYNINTSGALSALVRCTAPHDNETYVIECGMNGQWNTDITDNCSSSNPNIIQTTISEYYKYKNILMMYALHLIENDINFMADTTSIINSTVSCYFYIPIVVGVCSQDINEMGAIHIKASV